MVDDLLEDDIEQLWAEEAIRRDAEMDSDLSLRTAEDVFRDARMRLWIKSV
jgi:hypothetical protein